jgi:xanthine dehydrogenase accessory factor
MKAFVRSVCELIKQGETLALATVVESTGSTPRSSGAKMAVRADGSIVGTIGGGLAEAKACQDGRAMVADKDGRAMIADKEGPAMVAGEGAAAQLTFVDMTEELAANSDMICGGGLSILLERVEPGSACANAYCQLDERLRQGLASVLVTRLKDAGGLRVVGHDLQTEGWPENGPCFEREGVDMCLTEPFIPPSSLYIFGAGHVSLFTARVGSMIGFRTVVLDDRDDFANWERFPEADQVVVLPNFEGCCDQLGIDEGAFIVIVTRGHLHDRNVLAEALRTKARYVGMIGSRKKRDKIYESLLADGFTQADIDRCHCPIGHAIGAQTPEEIAVSIMAELIQTRSEPQP